MGYSCWCYLECLVAVNNVGANGFAVLASLDTCLNFHVELLG